MLRLLGNNFYKNIHKFSILLFLVLMSVLLYSTSLTISNEPEPDPVLNNLKRTHSFAADAATSGKLASLKILPGKDEKKQNEEETLNTKWTNIFHEIGRKHGTDKVTNHAYHTFYGLFLGPIRNKV
jgi:hypothetical protein